MYLDPSSWSMLVQVIVGTLVAIPALVGIYWRHIKLFFMRLKSGKSK